MSDLDTYYYQREVRVCRKQLDKLEDCLYNFGFDTEEGEDVVDAAIRYLTEYNDILNNGFSGSCNNK